MECLECGAGFNRYLTMQVTCSMTCYQARYRRVNREKRAESKRLSYLKNRDKAAANAKAFRQANAARLRAFDLGRRPRKVWEPRVCASCEVEFMPRLEPQKFCSITCQRRSKDRPSAYKPKGPTEKVCPECGVSFSAFPKNQKYCGSDPCKQAVMIRGVRKWEAKNPDKRLAMNRAAGHRRRSRERSLPSEKYNVLDIYERDGWICQLCFKPVDPSLTGNDPDGPQIDHIIPYAHPTCPGNLISNVQLAHKRCNSSKQDKYQ